MSSSNRVQVAVIAESVYGVTPGAGNFTAFRMTSEDLTGDPTVVESEELRSDRQRGGQIKTGMVLAGGINFQLSADASIQLAIEHAMMSDVVAAVTHAGTVTIATSGTELTTSGSFTGDVSVGDMLQLSGFSTAANNTIVMVSAVTSGTLDIVGEGLVDEGGGSCEVPSYHTIGTTKKSLSVSKNFLDLGNRSIAYTGERVSELAMTFAFGSIVTGRVGLVGNGYDIPTLPITNSRTITAAGSSEDLDASNGFGWLLVDNADIDICLESLDFTLNNNLQAVTCVGQTVAKDQEPGSASVTFNSTMHLGTASWDTFMSAKLDQTPVSLAFWVGDSSQNGYGVVMDRVQLSFPDPQATGKDALVTLGATGMASYDSTSGETMRIYIF